MRVLLAPSKEKQMTEQLAQALEQLRNVLQAEAHEHCVAVRVFFNSEGYEIEHQARTPSGLQRDGISMRNLRGEWVK
jgi:hypothetical protein